MPGPINSPLTAMARQQQGIPTGQGGAVAPPAAGVQDLLLALRSGQFDPQLLLQLLAVLTGGGMPGGGAGAANPIESAFLG